MILVQAEFIPFFNDGCDTWKVDPLVESVDQIMPELLRLYKQEFDPYFAPVQSLEELMHSHIIKIEISYEFGPPTGAIA